MQIQRPICIGCRHLREGLDCDAFPVRIPDAILESHVDHRQPVEGDHGVQFEPTNAEAAQYAASLFEETHS